MRRSLCIDPKIGRCRGGKSSAHLWQNGIIDKGGKFSAPTKENYFKDNKNEQKFIGRPEQGAESQAV
jgi:hypothetical protein